MNKLILAAAPLALALAACGGNDVDDTSENVDITVDGDEVAMGNETSSVEGTPYADTAWEYSGPDGTIMTTSLRSDGSYQDVGAGEVFDQGTWSWSADRQVCFDSSMEDENDACWSGPPAPVETGQSYVANSQDGLSMELKRVAYRPAAKEAPGT